MELSPQFYAVRFQELSAILKGVPAITTKARSVAEHRLIDEAGELFISATRAGLFDALLGADDLVREYEDAESAYSAGNLVGFVDGRRFDYASRPQALRTPCPFNLFLDVAGNERIEVFNDNGKLIPTRTLPPSGLLPEALPALFKASPFLLLQTEDSDEADDFSRLARHNTIDRYSLACRLLAEIVAASSHDLITIAEIAYLAGVSEKTIYNKQESLPAPRVPKAGRAPARYEYKAIRSWVAKYLKKRLSLFPESYAAACGRLRPTETGDSHDDTSVHLGR